MPACLFKVPLPKNTQMRQTHVKTYTKATLFIWSLTRHCAGNCKLHIKTSSEAHMEHFSLSCSTQTKLFNGKWSAYKSLYVFVGLTGSSSGGAFPECVLEGNFSQVLSQFLSFVCAAARQRECNENTKHWDNQRDTKICCGERKMRVGIPLRSSRRWGLPLSRGVSPYLLQMLTWAPLVTRSWEEGQIGVSTF